MLDAIAERIREDVGELGDFACRIVRGAGRLTVAEAWQAWCKHNDEPEAATEAGGIGKLRLSGALRDHVPGLPTAKATSVGGKVARAGGSAGSCWMRSRSPARRTWPRTRRRLDRRCRRSGNGWRRYPGA